MTKRYPVQFYFQSVMKDGKRGRFVLYMWVGRRCARRFREYVREIFQISLTFVLTFVLIAIFIPCKQSHIDGKLPHNFCNIHVPIIFHIRQRKCCKLPHIIGTIHWNIPIRARTNAHTKHIHLRNLGTRRCTLNEFFHSYRCKL